MAEIRFKYRAPAIQTHEAFLRDLREKRSFDVIMGGKLKRVTGEIVKIGEVKEVNEGTPMLEAEVLIEGKMKKHSKDQEYERG